MDTFKPADRERLPLQGPHWHRGPSPEAPPDFFPLRLILQPSGYSVELTRTDMVLGRHSEADIRLPLPDVSRRHCRFAFLDGCWQLFDLSSLNGTCVNGQYVAHAFLSNGDRVRMGGFTFEVQLRDSYPTLPLTLRPPTAADEMIHRIAEALPAPAETDRGREEGPGKPMRRAS